MTPTPSAFAGAALHSFQKFKMISGDKHLTMNLDLPVTLDFGVQFTC